MEDQSFQHITQPALYERLKREAIASEEERVPVAAPEATLDLKAETAFAPLIVRKMLAVGPMGSQILAAGDGTVVLISWEPAYGRYVRVRHDEGYFTTYAHIARTVKGLAVVQRVTQGQTIAYVGSTGLSTGPHLYYELRKDNHYPDPTANPLLAGTILSGHTLNDFHRQVGHIADMGKLMDVPGQRMSASAHG